MKRSIFWYKIESLYTSKLMIKKKHKAKKNLEKWQNIRQRYKHG